MEQQEQKLLRMRDLTEVNFQVKERYILTEQIKIKYMHPDTKRLEAIDIGDWIDMYADEQIVMYPGQFINIPLGVAMELPRGYEAHLAPRSSTFKTWGILAANSFGVIDESYKGDNDEWHFPAFFPVGGTLKQTVIHRGDKIAQFRIMKKMPRIDFIEVESLGNPDRGGLGSTGTR